MNMKLKPLQLSNTAKEGNVKIKSLASLKTLNTSKEVKVEEEEVKKEVEVVKEVKAQQNENIVATNSLQDKSSEQMSLDVETTEDNSAENNEDKKDKKDKKEDKDKKGGGGGGKKPPMRYNGPRAVIVYGQELFIEEDPTVSLEDIRKRLVEEYGFTEFKDKSKCQIHFDAKTGEVFPILELKKKG